MRLAAHGFFAAHGLHAFALAAHGFLAAHGLHGLHPFFAAHGLQGLQALFFAAHGLHGLHWASWMVDGFGLATGSGFIRSADRSDAYPGPLGATAPPTTTPAPTRTGINVLERSFDFIDLTTWPPLASLFARGNAQI